MVTLCNDPNCNLLANHKGKHQFVYKKAWKDHFTAEDINKIEKAGYCTPRGGAKGGYQNHVNRNNKVDGYRQERNAGEFQQIKQLLLRELRNDRVKEKTRD